MPDITMCSNEECELRIDCFRFMALPNPWRQSYFAPDSIPQPKNGKCDDFMVIFKPSAYDLRDVENDIY